MKLIVGLGNPGIQYENTRHNIGFIVLDKLLEEVSSLKNTVWERISEGSVVGRGGKKLALVKKVIFEGTQVVLSKPQVFMNNSGQVVNFLLKQYELSPNDIFVVYDDLDLPIGKLRVRMGGAAGGHKGVESIISAIGSDMFLRIRLGIGRPTRHEGSQRDKSTLSVDDYVLSNFTADKGKVRTMTKEAIRTLKILVKNGIEKYMSKYNKK